MCVLRKLTCAVALLFVTGGAQAHFQQIIPQLTWPNPAPP